MKRALRQLSLVLLLAVGAWLWTVFFPRPEVVIQRRLAKVAQLVSFAPKEGNIARVANVQRLGGYFADGLEVQLGDARLKDHTFTRREELLQACMAARQAVAALQVRFVDVQVKLGAPADHAAAELTLEANVAGEADPIYQQLRFDLVNTNGDWLITRIAAVKTLTP